MNYKQLFTLLVILFSPEINAQNGDTTNLKKAGLHTLKKSSVSLEAFGHGLWYSLNYERVLLYNASSKIAVQVGLSVYPVLGSSYNHIDTWLPISINFKQAISHNRQHHIELGVGHSFSYDRYTDSRQFNSTYKFITFKAGYRYQKIDGRWIYKLLFTPLLEYDIPAAGNATTQEFHPWGTVSVGYSF